MTSPNHETPTTPGWASPARQPAEGPGAQQGPPQWTPQDIPQDSPQGAPQDAPRGPTPPPPGYYGPGQPGPGYAGASQPGPGYVGPGYANAPGYGPAGGYRPPAAQPGIVPLRPLGLGEILDGAFRAIRANPRVMFGLTALVVTITVALQTVVQWYVGGLLSGSLADATSTIDPTGELALTESIAPTIGPILTLPALALATTVLTGLLIVSVSRSVLGQKVTIGEVWREYKGRVGLVVVFTILLSVATVVVVAILVGIVVLLATNQHEILGVTVGLIGGATFFVAYVWVLVRTLLVPPAIMLEGAGLWSAVRRGWTLSRGSFWRLLGIYLLTSIIVSIVQGLITAPATIISTFVFQDPLSTSFGSLVLLGVANIVALTLTTVFTAAVVALLYVDVRMRREGLDVELARAAGATTA
ncbi:glycerophosphoryl diester phosphodiesterase membrane domain-containing protein [Pengzhenrongella frigida]|uniref:DUF7847 domain-containing protein n=1 Tax=Pengzhenrongella frigida TaxID=1259133 RepID=A0A4Q5MX60_9MICO|nr:glycerophosphoryl diester phosphodiesterase membrane domain-containing protein [Cellulomonas sp. HLT2-17]RYV50185.1 hypothetical protein EUA98_15080 [Cellulomonas sp. HLT2-17]